MIKTETYSITIEKLDLASANELATAIFNIKDRLRLSADALRDADIQGFLLSSGKAQDIVDWVHKGHAAWVAREIPSGSVLGFITTSTFRDFVLDHQSTTFRSASGTDLDIGTALNRDLNARGDAPVYISQIAVDPDHNRKGVGSALMSAVEDFFGTDEGYFAAIVQFPHENSVSKTFFERHGYDCIGFFSTENLAGWPRVDSWVMAK